MTEITVPGESVGHNNRNFSFKTKLREPIFLEGVWLCGLAELILPDRSSSGLIPALSLVREGPAEHVGAGQSTPVSAPLSAGEGKGSGGATTTQESTRTGRDPPPAIRPEAQSTARESATVGSTASGDHTGQLSAIGNAAPLVEGVSAPPRQPGHSPRLPTPTAPSANIPSSQPIGPLPPTPGTGPVYVKIPIDEGGREKTIEEILSYTFRENVVTLKSGQKFLDQLSSLSVPEYIQNVVMEGAEEKVSAIRLSDGSALAYSWSDQSTPQEWLDNLLTFARSDEEAAEWIRRAVGCWRTLLDTLTPLPRKQRAVSYKVSESTRNNAISLVFVYCDIVQWSLMSDTKARCVRVVPVSPKSSVYSLFPVHYIACSRKIIESVHIELRTRWDTYVEFNNEYQPTVAVLHFRRIR